MSDDRHKNRCRYAGAAVELDDEYCDCGRTLKMRQAVIESLQSRLTEITDAHRVVMEERCHADERHCTCVPVLRAEVTRLSRELEQASEVYLRSVISQRESDCREKDAEIERLQKQVGELQGERASLLGGVRYWSYCMDVGMRHECPEKVEELVDFLIWCKVAPYSMPLRGGRG